MKTDESMGGWLEDPAVLEQARRGFKVFNRFMLLIWRLGLGAQLNSAPSIGGQIMVLTHIGRKSGERRRTPVNYAIVEGDIYCTAGFGGVSDWYRNIKANPEVEVWLPEGWWRGVAEEITAPPSRLPLLREVLVASGFVAPLLGIDPRGMSDEALDKLTADYRLVRIRRTEMRSGPGGPGDLAWVWPAATAVLLPLCLALLFRRRR